MALTFFIKILSDIAMYMTAASFIGGGLEIIGSRLFIPCLIAAAAGALGFLVNDKAKSKQLRFLPLLIMGAMFIFTKTTAEIIIAAVPAAYVIFITAKSLYNISWYNAVDSFRVMVKIQAGMLVMFVVIGGLKRLAYWALPYTVIYLVAAVLSMRCYRHSAQAASEPRFQLMNGASVVGVMGIALFLFSDAFINSVKAVANFVYSNLIAPLLMGVAYVFVGIMWVVENTLGKLINNADGEATQLEINIVENLTEELEQLAGEQRQTSPVFLWIVRILLLIAAAVIIVLIFRRLMPNGKKAKEQSSGTRGGTDKPVYKRKRENIIPRTEEEKVRFYYKKGLILAQNNGAELKKEYDSAQLTSLTEVALDDETGAPQRLRQLYLPARYGKKSQKGDGEKAKGEYKQLKDGARQKRKNA